MIPIDPKLAASALYQSAGLSSQSAQRRYWMNRFRFGRQRTITGQMQMQTAEHFNEGANMTAPGGIPWSPTSPLTAQINPLMPLPTQRPTFGAPQDLMGLSRSLPGVGQNPAQQTDEGAGQIPHYYQQPPARVGDNPLYEDSARGQWEADIQRSGPTEGKGVQDYQTRYRRGPG